MLALVRFLSHYVFFVCLACFIFVFMYIVRFSSSCSFLVCFSSLFLPTCYLPPPPSSCCSSCCFSCYPRLLLLILLMCVARPQCFLPLQMRKCHSRLRTTGHGRRTCRQRPACRRLRGLNACMSKAILPRKCKATVAPLPPTAIFALASKPPVAGVDHPPRAILRASGSTGRPPGRAAKLCV